MRGWIAVAGAASGGIAVAAGAFGAHGLRGRLDAEALAVFETAVRYQAFHALALLVVALALRADPRRTWRVAACLFAAGTVLFSGSLYALALSGVKAFGAVTPFGGAAFLAGWAALVVGAWPAGPGQRR